MREAAYFELPASKPLLHLWSLGVEEQFYLLWPAILAVALRWKRPALVVVLVVTASFALNLWGAANFPQANFYSPLARAWQLACGAALAFFPMPRGKGSGAAPHGLSLLGAALLGWSFLFTDSAGGYPAWGALLPTVGAAMLIAAGPKGLVNRRLLSCRPAVGIGLISYSLYLWHWPLIGLASSLTLDRPGLGWGLCAVAVSFPLAWATWRFVEQPARRRGAATALLLLAATVVVAAVAALWLQAPERLKPIVDPRREFVAYYRHLPFESGGTSTDCSLGRTWLGRPKGLPADCAQPGPRGTWLIWGDSHARALAAGLRQEMPQGIKLAVLVGDGCPPLTRYDRRCAETADYGMELVRRLRPELVLLVQRNGHETRDWDGIARPIEAAGAGRAVVIGPVPQWRRALPGIVAERFWPNPPLYLSEELDQEVLASDLRLRRHRTAGSRVPAISLIEDLCTPAGCRAVVPGAGPHAMIHFDYGHLTEEGSRFVAREVLMPKLLKIARRAPEAAAK
jgi:hypothetical protein